MNHLGRDRAHQEFLQSTATVGSHDNLVTLQGISQLAYFIGDATNQMVAGVSGLGGIKKLAGTVHGLFALLAVKFGNLFIAGKSRHIMRKRGLYVDQVDVQILRVTIA